MRAILLSWRRATFLSSNKLGWFFFVKRTRPEKRGRFSYLRWRKNHSFCLWGENILFSFDEEQVPLFSLERRGQFFSYMVGSYSSLSRREGLLSSFLNGGRAIFFSLQRREPFSSLWRRATFFSLNERGWFFFVKRTRPDKRRQFSYLKWGKNHSLLSSTERLPLSI